MKNLIRMLISTAALAIAACSGDDPEPAVIASPVMVTDVEARTLIENIQSTGELLAVAEARVSAEVGGRITEIAVKEGASVEAAQTVIAIDPERRRLELESERAHVSEARQAIGRAERDAERRRSLHSKNVGSEAALDSAETDLAAARSRLVAAEAKLGLSERALRDASVAAPFSGLIARRYVGVGDFVNPGQQLFDLIALDPIEVEFNLTERDSGRVTIGDNVIVRVAPYPDESFTATVSMVSPRIDVTTRTLRVKATLPNPDGRLRPGLFARADLGVAQREHIAMIPEDAVLQRSDGAVVFRMVGTDRVERRAIRLGVFRDGMVEAVSGIEIGDRVVVRGQSRLIDGSPVEIRRADGSVGGPSIASAVDSEAAPVAR